MKKTKKLLSILLAATMTFAMAAPTFAEITTDSAPTETEVALESSPGQIIINNAIDGQEYKIYQILTAVKNEDNTSVAYALNPKWNGFLAYTNTELGSVSDYLEEVAGNVRWKGDKSTDRAAALSKLASAFVTAKGMVPDDSQEASEGIVNFTRLQLGYYFIDSSAGTLCILDTNMPEAVITEKNEIPEIDKNILQGTGDTPADTNTASIGDYIKYQVVITVKPGAENYTVHDAMSTGLEFVNDAEHSLVVEKKDVAEGSQIETVANTNYTLKTNDLHDEKCTFEVEFNDAFVTGLENGDQIFVTYYARLTDAAVIGTDGNTNKAKLEYGNNGVYTTETTTTTYSYDVDVLKYTPGDDGGQTPLAGAEFTLSKNQDGTNPITVKLNNETTYKVVDMVAFDAMEEGEPKEAEKALHKTTITTTATGTFTIEGLAEGVYYLTETKAPAGYNKLPSAIMVTVDSNGTIKQGTDAVIVNQIEVENNTGAILPGTGGIGTTIFYAVGIILMAGAVFFVVRRKRA